MPWVRSADGYWHFRAAYWHHVQESAVQQDFQEQLDALLQFFFTFSHEAAPLCHWFYSSVVTSSFQVFQFFPLLSWSCFILHFFIALCALMALIPFCLHFFDMFLGMSTSPVFICPINVTYLLTMPLLFIICFILALHNLLLFSFLLYSTLVTT